MGGTRMGLQERCRRRLWVLIVHGGEAVVRSFPRSYWAERGGRGHAQGLRSVALLRSRLLCRDFGLAR